MGSLFTKKSIRGAFTEVAENILSKVYTLMQTSKPAFKLLNYWGMFQQDQIKTLAEKLAIIPKTTSQILRTLGVNNSHAVKLHTGCVASKITQFPPSEKDPVQLGFVFT
jgi:predicted metallopeptidase